MSEPERLPNEFAPTHVGPWSDRCPRCGTRAPEPVTRCSLCRLPNPTPVGAMLPQHDDPEALL